MKNIDDLILRYPALEGVKDDICKSVKDITDCFEKGNKILVCGNGGSAADSVHIVGELMKSFRKTRKVVNTDVIDNIRRLCCAEQQHIIETNLERGFPAISLVSEISLITAYSNDCCPDMIFAQQVYGYGKKGDVLICISTSGNSKNVVLASIVAKAMGLKVISLTGCRGGKLKEFSDNLISVSESETYKIQELHLPIYHAICAEVEE